MTELHEILYINTLAPDQTPNVVGQIVSQARARNAQYGITGLLVFDGLQFCQHFEGPTRDVLYLADRLTQDARHTDVRVLHEGVLEARRYQRFDMGFAEVEGPDGLADLPQLDGEAALARFLAMRPRFDISG